MVVRVSTEISDLLETAAAPVTGVVGGVRDDQLDLPTPCTEFAVRDVLRHLLQVTANFRALARREEADWGAGPERLSGDWRGAFAAGLAEVTGAWSDPAALDGVSPGMGLPQRTVGLMLAVDLVVHSWDLAAATGQPFEPGPALIAATGCVSSQSTRSRTDVETLLAKRPEAPRSAPVPARAAPPAPSTDTRSPCSASRLLSAASSGSRNPSTSVLVACQPLGCLRTVLAAPTRRASASASLDARSASSLNGIVTLAPAMPRRSANVRKSSKVAARSGT